MPRLFTSVLILVVLCAAAAPLTAQEGEQPAPAHVSAVEGTAVLEREGRGEDLALNMPLLVGDRLRTDEGRAEALLPDGSVLALDRHSMADLLAGGLVRLTAGRMVFVVASAGAGQGAREYQVDAPGGAIRMAVPGEYRISLLGSPERPAVGLAVVRGQATLAGDRGSLVVNAGEQSAVASGEGPQATVRFNSAQPDAFYAWADERRAERVGARSNTYLPEELRVYGGTFDRYGSWQEAPEPGIGYVWYPRVAVDWRPYYYGSWWSYPSWGWTWVGYDPWAWPTHHYGRWGFGIGGGTGSPRVRGARRGWRGAAPRGTRPGAPSGIGAARSSRSAFTSVSAATTTPIGTGGRWCPTTRSPGRTTTWAPTP